MISKFLNSLINNPLLYPGSRYHQYIWLHPITKTPTLGFMRFTILVDPSMVIITEYSVCLIYMYAWEIFKAIIHFTMWLKWQRLSTGTSAQEIMKCTILVDFFLVIITLYSVFHICSHIYILIYSRLYPRIPPPPPGWGHEFTMSCPLALQMLHFNFG